MARYIPTVQGHSAKWREQIGWALDCHIWPELGADPIDKIDRHRIQTFLNKKVKGDGKKPGLARSSVMHIRKVLHAIFEIAEADEAVAKNPVRLTKLAPERVKEEKAPYTAEEIRKLLHVSYGAYYRNAEYMSATIGLREGECLGVEWTDIKKDHISVVRQAPDDDNSTSLKTTASRRRIPIPEGWADGLVKVRGKLVCGRASARNIVGIRSGFTKKGKPIKPRGYKGAAERAGLPDRTFHSLRAACATGLMSVGCPEALIAEILGHTRRGATAIYAKGSDEEKRKYLQLWFDQIRLHVVGVNEPSEVGVK